MIGVPGDGLAPRDDTGAREALSRRQDVLGELFFVLSSLMIDHELNPDTDASESGTFHALSLLALVLVSRKPILCLPHLLQFD